jgi:hypothetical protein
MAVPVGGLNETAWQESREHTGFALVLTGFDVFAGRRYRDARVLLEMIRDCAWPAIVQGRRVLCLVQSDDRDLALPRLGCWVDERTLD